MPEAAAAFLPHGGLTRVIATSRGEGWGGLARQVALEPLPATQRARLLLGREPAGEDGLGAVRLAIEVDGWTAGLAPLRDNTRRRGRRPVDTHHAPGPGPRPGLLRRVAAGARGTGPAGCAAGGGTGGLAADGPALVPGTLRAGGGVAGHRGHRGASCPRRVGLGLAGRSRRPGDGRGLAKDAEPGRNRGCRRGARALPAGLV